MRIVCVGLLCWIPLTGAADVWDSAATNAELNRKSLLYCWRYVNAWLQHVDPESGLIPRNLNKDAYWNAKDCAADNYPFMVLTAFFTDQALFEGKMHAMLETEQRLCNRVDRLPDDWDFASGVFRVPEPKLDELIFGASEYAKDGLLPLTEWLGRSPWFDRMLGLVEDIWKHAEIESEVGLLPAASHEVAGDLLQVLSRVYWATRDTRYRDWAFRLADYFLAHHLPTEAERLGLDDHGCEVIGGLSEAYFIAAQEDAARRERWRPAMHRMLDRILEVGRDENGLLYNAIDPRTGKVLSEDRTDNWGYNYNAFAVVARLDGVDRYDAAIRHVLSRLPENKDYPWERDTADGLADSLEGALNLINRYPIAEAKEWADYTAARLLEKQRDTGIVAGWHGDGNAARTLIMYALWKSQGCHVQPWRADLGVGAVRDTDGTVHVTVTAEWPWNGRLVFDRPRFVENFNLPEDYPRLNQFPEWLTVAEGQVYTVDHTAVPGASLREGLTVHANAESPARVTIAPDTE